MRLHKTTTKPGIEAQTVYSLRPVDHVRAL